MNINNINRGTLEEVMNGTDVTLAEYTFIENMCTTPKIYAYLYEDDNCEAHDTMEVIMNYYNTAPAAHMRNLSIVATNHEPGEYAFIPYWLHEYYTSAY